MKEGRNGYNQHQDRGQDSASDKSPWQHSHHDLESGGVCILPPTNFSIKQQLLLCGSYVYNKDHGYSVWST